jgi:hypothetical protein
MLKKTSRAELPYVPGSQPRDVTPEAAEKRVAGAAAYADQDLFELEVSFVDGAVRELDLQLPAGARPTLVGLPCVSVGICNGIITKAAAARCDCGLARINWRAAVAGDGLESRRAARQDVQALVAVQPRWPIRPSSG